MMLFVVPAEMRPTVTTAGSNTSTERVTISCSAWTTSHATGIGSVARCGSLAWPPLPVIVMCSVSAEAMIEPWRQLSQPDGSDDVMCRAKAPVTGDGVPSARSGTSSRPSSSMYRAPWWPSSPGWNMNSTRPARSDRRPASSLAAPASIAVWVSWPQACIDPSDSRAELEPGVLVQRQGVHVAAQQDRRPGLGPREQGGDAARRLVDGDVEGQALEGAEHGLLRHGQLVADLRPLVEGPAQPDRGSEEVVGFLTQRGRVDGHAAMVGTGRGCRSRAGRAG